MDETLREPTSPYRSTSGYVVAGSPTDQRRQWLQETKVRAGCARCGYNTHPEALDYHCIRGEKAFTLSLASASRSWEALQAEVAKCEILCANCHRVLTADARASRVEARRAQARTVPV